uniref:Uncharacterized protein n=1 Tax=Anguilla anguilla TaxID=7936 RepID=A0A0E9STJ6_ANGAN
MHCLGHTLYCKQMSVSRATAVTIPISYTLLRAAQNVVETMCLT